MQPIIFTGDGQGPEADIPADMHLPLQILHDHVPQEFWNDPVVMRKYELMLLVAWLRGEDIGFPHEDGGIAGSPGNDLCGNATVIARQGGTVAGTTIGAAANGSATCGTSNASPDVYYSWTPA